ncbi:hypothetical protein ACIQU4_38880 [Streptomyces sp. NPDC090741]|uniref:hypothetical protein n=1 Tax=Streptomyces sp. NPDC090741 TaxID=3365967 RepID=UPI00380AE56B
MSRPSTRIRTAATTLSRPRLPRLSNYAVDTADHGRIIDLRREADAPNRLPRGKRGGRYRCCACGKSLIFAAPATAGSGFTARFRHDAGGADPDRCKAPAARAAGIQADLTLAFDLHDRLAQALPATTVRVEIDPALAGSEWNLPPAVILRRGRHLAVIDRPRRLLNHRTTQARLQAVRAARGEHIAHWWFYDRDDQHAFDYAGTHTVRVSGEPTVHDKVRPTPDQRLINAFGAQVCWLAAQKILVPYGGRPVTHPARDGEDWSGDTARWADDWAISHPHPAPDAAWWGLVRIPLTALAQPAFRPVPAHRIMAALAASQRGREEHRRALARTAYNRRRPIPVQLTLDTALPTAPARGETTPVRPAAPVPVPSPVFEPGHSTEPLPHVPSRHTKARWSWRRFLPRRWR